MREAHNSTAWQAWIPALLVGVAVLLYRQCATFPYVLDDNYVIASNRWVQQGARGMWELLNSTYWQGFYSGFAEYYRPLPMLSYALEFELFGFDPGISHAVNVAIYGASAAALYYLLRRLLTGPMLPAVATALFVLSPLHVEVTANIKSRDELLALLFQLGVLAWGLDVARCTEGRTWPKRLGAGLLMLLALLTKENALVTVALMPLTLWCFSELPWRLLLTLSAQLTLLPAIPYFVQRYRVTGHLLRVQGEGGEELSNNALWAAQSASESVGMVFWIFADYARLLLWPDPLLWDRSLGYIPLATLGHPQALAGLALAVLLGGLLIWQLPKRSPWAWALGWMAIAYAIPSNTVVKIVGSTMAERYLYLMTAGFCVLLALSIHALARRLTGDTRGRLAALLLALPLALAWGYASAQRIPQWGSLKQLVYTDAPRSPGNARLVNGQLGMLLGELERAQSPEQKRTLTAQTSQVLERSGALLEEDPRRYVLLQDALHWSAGQLAFRQQDWGSARQSFEALTSLKPEHFQAWWHLGFSCYEMGDYSCASAAYYEALRFRPKQGFAPGDRVLLQDYYFNLCLAEQALGAWSESLESCQGALDWQEDHARALAGMGIAHEQLGDAEQAQRYFERAFALEPGLRPE